MPIYDFALTADQTGNLESKLADRRAHPTHGGLLLARIARILAKPSNWPKLDARVAGRFSHPPLNTNLRFHSSTENLARHDLLGFKRIGPLFLKGPTKLAASSSAHRPSKSRNRRGGGEADCS